MFNKKYKMNLDSVTARERYCVSFAFIPSNSLGICDASLHDQLPTRPSYSSWHLIDITIIIYWISNKV